MSLIVNRGLFSLWNPWSPVSFVCVSCLHMRPQGSVFMPALGRVTEQPNISSQDGNCSYSKPSFLVQSPTSTLLPTHELWIPCSWTHVCACWGKLRCGWCGSCDHRMECARCVSRLQVAAQSCLSCVSFYLSLQLTETTLLLSFLLVRLFFWRSAKPSHLHFLQTFAQVYSKCRGIRGFSHWLPNLSGSLEHICLEIKLICFSW